MSRVAIGLAAVVVLGACKGEDADSGSADGPVAYIKGSLGPDGEDITGEFAVYKAVAFDQGGRFLAYLSSDPEASCDNIVDYLYTDGDPYAPDDVINGGHCNMFLAIDGYEDGLNHTWDRSMEGGTGFDAIGAGTSIACAMGSGEFVYEQRDNDDEDYFWSGRWWQGSPKDYTFAFSGSGEGGYTLDLTMSEFDGEWPYEGFDSHPASGNVSGTIEAEYCQGLATTGLF